MNGTEFLIWNLCKYNTSVLSVHLPLRKNTCTPYKLIELKLCSYFSDGRAHVWLSADAKCPHSSGTRLTYSFVRLAAAKQSSACRMHATGVPAFRDHPFCCCTLTNGSTRSYSNFFASVPCHIKQATRTTSFSCESTLAPPSPTHS